MSSIFVKIEVKDYIPSEMADFANALVDPIAHLSNVHLNTIYAKLNYLLNRLL